MNVKKLHSVKSDMSELNMTKDERYELIAQIAQRINESKDSHSTEESLIWDSNDIELNFDLVVNSYN